MNYKSWGVPSLGTYDYLQSALVITSAQTQYPLTLVVGGLEHQGKTINNSIGSWTNLFAVAL